MVTPSRPSSDPSGRARSCSPGYSAGLSRHPAVSQANSGLVKLVSASISAQNACIGTYGIEMADKGAGGSKNASKVKGGLARARAMSPEKRSEIDRKSTRLNSSH